MHEECNALVYGVTVIRGITVIYSITANLWMNTMHIAYRVPAIHGVIDSIITYLRMTTMNWTSLVKES